MTRCGNREAVTYVRILLFPFKKGTDPQEAPAGPLLLFALALPMHRTACAAATARAAAAAADMLACLLVQNQPSDNQYDNCKEDQTDHDRSEICFYPRKHFTNLLSKSITEAFPFAAIP